VIIWQDQHTTLFKSALYETISSVVLTEDCILVVDPCWLPHEVEEIKNHVELNRENRPLYLLFTHSDYDHIIGYKAFSDDAIVVASEAFSSKSRAEKDSVVEQIKEFDDEYYITRNYEIEYPKVDIPIAAEGTVITIGKTILAFFEAHGHTNDGIFTVIEPLGVLLAGDYLSDIEFPFIYDDSIQYEKTIRKLDYILEHYDIRLLVTGHGNPTNAILDMKKRQKEALDYIQRMRKFIIEGDQDGLKQLIMGCKFPRNLQKCHQYNVSQIQRELKHTLS
jgi:glyoxylase-like metal-dependent hydrolase (beta-lactamase superfamily II)